MVIADPVTGLPDYRSDDTPIITPLFDPNNIDPRQLLLMNLNIFLIYLINCSKSSDKVVSQYSDEMLDSLGSIRERYLSHLNSLEGDE